MNALKVVQEQLEQATAARKCHRCGCFQKTVEALTPTEVGRNHLDEVLSAARASFVPIEYDCLGCPVCFPAVAADAFGAVDPIVAEGLDLCPAEPVSARNGWPPLAGDYRVVQYRAPVAVCTLNDRRLGDELCAAAPEGLAIVGTLHTENLGIERLAQNILANPFVRFLILCGDDTQQAMGHLPGQTLVSLFENGTDENGRIRGAKGKRPVLKNLNPNQIRAFVQHVELVDLIGEQRCQSVAERVVACALRSPGPSGPPPPGPNVETLHSVEPWRLIPDPGGFLVVYPDRRLGHLVVEHYSNDGLLDCVVDGETSSALYSRVIERGLLTRLDHAAYLGRELARAERSLETGEPYVQDRAPGVEERRAGNEPAISPCGASGTQCDQEGAR